MGRYYGIPSAVTGSSTDVSVFDVQNGAETMSHIFPATLSDADLITGIGSNSNACGTSAEQILIDAELLRLAEHFRKGISLDNMYNMFDIITRVQPGGSYASDDSTLEQFKSTNEFFIPELINWSGHSRCEAGLYGKAKLKAEFILENHIPAVPADRLEQLHKYVRNKEKAIMK